MITNIYGGGGGNYANSGSSGGAFTYLKHEDRERIKESKSVEPIFSQDQNKVRLSSAIIDIDNNKKGLKSDASKFFVIEINPSQKELKSMGNTEAERSAAMKDFIRSEVMPNYASNFGKGLTEKDLKYYAKIHHTRGDKKELQTHAHIVVSRKTADMSKSISPMTNHRKASKGVIKSGFDRKNFQTEIERSFDKRFEYKRELEDKFEYKLASKQDNTAEIDRLKREHKNQEQKKNQELTRRENKIKPRSRDHGLSM